MEYLATLTQPMDKIPGLRPAIGQRLKKLIPGGRFLDLCFHRPSHVVQWHYPKKKTEWRPLQLVHLRVKVIHHSSVKGSRKPDLIQTVDPAYPDEEGVELVFFNPRYKSYLPKLFPIGRLAVVSGKLERGESPEKWRMVHPDVRSGGEKEEREEPYVPVYPLTAGLTQKMIRKTILQGLSHVPQLPEWISAEVREKWGWPQWYEALFKLHHPTGLEIEAKVLERFSYDELLAHQLALALIRQRRHKSCGRSLLGTGELRNQLKASLPFSLTPDQEKVVAEISQDMAGPHRMMRLLQGDVGSGKTLVAMMAILQAVESGAQAVLLAPTEILARQHESVLKKFLEPLGVRVGMLMGKQSEKRAKEQREALARGDVNLVVGTHALLEDRVSFKDLGLAVIDEQHRFGVNQRLRLLSKGEAVDVLSMTATPIPRTLQLTAFGDMDVSRIFQKPVGRQPITTKIMSLEKVDLLMAELKRPLAHGAQVYWVCPLVEESEDLDLAAAEERYHSLKDIYGQEVVLVHGQMKVGEKEAAMEKFRRGQAKIMVATTVIEVGVDVPQATLMIIEHAEKFGLSQLHQLRGRVGRGSQESTCILVAPPSVGYGAKARLDILRRTEDGFRIAEVDLRLRGGGEITGTKQSGLPDYKFANPLEQEDLLALAQEEATLFLQKDPTLSSQQGRALRVLLHLLYPMTLDMA
jgi:ATP-dependent DNA helicase RecG